MFLFLLYDLSFYMFFFLLTMICFLITKFACYKCIMEIWKEREREVLDNQAANDPATIEALRNCGLLKYFRVPSMKAHIQLLEYIIEMWDTDQQHFVMGIHILLIEVEDIYFLNGLSMRGIPVALSRARGGETSLHDLIDQY